MADRVEYVLRITEVTHIARPHGPGRENPPHLWDLRKFVAECDGLPDGMVVSIKDGPSAAKDAGRRDVTFAVTLKEPVTDEMVEERASRLDWFKRTSKTEETP
jgi:hypothetical protein